MVKGLQKNYKNKESLIMIHNFLIIYDKVLKTNLSKEFYLIFMDKNIHTIKNIAFLTNNSLSTVRRHICLFIQLVLQDIT